MARSRPKARSIHGPLPPGRAPPSPAASQHLSVGAAVPAPQAHFGAAPAARPARGCAGRSCRCARGEDCGDRKPVLRWLASPGSFCLGFLSVVAENDSKCLFHGSESREFGRGFNGAAVGVSVPGGVCSSQVVLLPGLLAASSSPEPLSASPLPHTHIPLSPAFCPVLPPLRALGVTSTEMVALFLQFSQLATLITPATKFSPYEQHSYRIETLRRNQSFMMRDFIYF